METAYVGGGAAIIMGLIQLLKMVGFPSKYCGLLAVALGLLGSLGFFLLQGHQELLATIETGLLMGLVSAGVYSGGKALMQKSEGQPE